MTSLRAVPRAGLYRVGYADPPWKFKAHAPPKEDAKGRRDAERHYPTMPLKDILALGAGSYLAWRGAEGTCPIKAAYVRHFG